MRLVRGLALPLRGPLAALAGVFALGVPVLAFGAPAITCRAERAGERTLVTGRAADLFDRELVRLIELGLVGRLHVEATLYRPRGFWFDARVAESKQVFALTWSKALGEFRLDGRRVADPQRLELPVIALQPEEPGASYVALTLRLEVITARSLGRVATWLVRGDSPARNGDESAARTTDDSDQATPLPRALIEYLAADLVRTASARCPLAR